MVVRLLRQATSDSLRGVSLKGGQELRIGGQFGEVKVRLTLQGMTAVNPGLKGMTPEAVNSSPPAEATTDVLLNVASGLMDPRK